MRGEELSQWREKQGLSQAELARALEVNRQTVITWEKSDKVTKLITVALKAIESGLVDLTHIKSKKVGRPSKELMRKIDRG
jgi:DNA-binding XRE family transcriptional regulator